jgi:methyl-accepting chemotaxis protein
MFFTKVFGRSNARSDMDAINRSFAIIEFDPTGIILRANENFCKALGYALSEIEGKHHSIFVLPEDARGGEYLAFWEKLRSGQFDAGEYRRIGKGGRDVWIQASYNPVLNAAGEVVKVIKVAADITAEKMSALESKSLRTAFSRSQAMIEFKKDGTILTANENFLGAVGYELDEIQGRHHRMFVDPAYARSSQYAEFWKRLGSGEFFCRRVQADRQGRPRNLDSSQLQSDHRSGQQSCQSGEIRHGRHGKSSIGRRGRNGFGAPRPRRSDQKN